MSVEISLAAPADAIGTDELFKGLRAMIAACEGGANKHELLTICIEACLDQGINTRTHLIGVLGQLGFKRGHVCIILDKETGFNPESHRWSKNVRDGTYSRLEVLGNPPTTTGKASAV